jgi:RHS repeat-associated protein
MTWSYDAQGRTTNKGQAIGGIGGVSHSIGYGYNAQGQLATIQFPSGKTIQYGYNANGQVTSVTLLGSPNVTILNNVSYDPFGPVTGWAWGNGNTSTRAFDSDGKVTNIGHSSSVVGTRTLGYDDAFRITSTADSASGGPSWTYGYDLLDRLNSASKSGTTIGYTYDSNGNRLTQTGTSASTYTVSGTSNRLSASTGALVRSYTYDNSGSVLTSGATTHTYYNNGRLKTSKLGTANATTYTYNALGQRVKKVGGGALTTFFLYDEAGHLAAEFNGVGSVSQEIVWLGDIPVATLRSGSIWYIHTDQLNTPRKVTSSASTPLLKWRWDPTPFGEGAPSEPNGTFAFHLRFPGQYYDVESTLGYNYFRDYDPAIGRYVESDPIGLNGGNSTYAYAGLRPTFGADPRGLFSLSVRETLSVVHDLASGGETRLGLIRNRCDCEEGCEGWTLRECSTSFEIKVALLAGVSDFDERRFYARSEQQHVRDLRDAMDEMQRAGDSIESYVRKRTFKTKEECERLALQLVTDTMKGILQNALDKSYAKWDATNRHTWYSPSRWWGF